MTHVEAEVFIANEVQAEAVHQLMQSYTNKMPSSLRIMDGVVDTSVALKEQVPVSFEDIKTNCAEEIGKCSLDIKCQTAKVGITCILSNPFDSDEQKRIVLDWHTWRQGHA